MRKFMSIIIGMLLSLSATAQNDTIGNFIKEGKTLIWQKVYNYNGEDSLKVRNFLFNNPAFRNTSTDNQTQGITYPILKNLCNYDYASRPVFFNNEARIKYIIQIKDNRYRITVISIEPRDIYGNFTFASAAMLDMQDYENAKYLSNMFDGGIWFKKNSELRPATLKVLPILDEVLIKLFKYNYKTTLQIDDNF